MSKDYFYATFNIGSGEIAIQAKDSQCQAQITKKCYIPCELSIESVIEYLDEEFKLKDKTIALQQRVIELMVQQILLNIDNIEHGRNVEDTINYYTQKAKEQI